MAASLSLLRKASSSVPDIKNRPIFMSTLIYYLRHAQSLQESAKETANWHLTKLGYQQAAKLADILGQIEFTEIYSSPYKRCLETIAPYCKKYERVYQSHEDLKERLLVPSFNKKNYQEVHRKSWTYFSFSLPGCESSKSAQERIVSVLKLIANKHPGEKILVSGHGQLLALVLHHIDRSFGFKDQYGLLNPDLRVFKVTGGLLEESEDSHDLQSKIKKIAVPAMKF